MWIELSMIMLVMFGIGSHLHGHAPSSSISSAIASAVAIILTCSSFNVFSAFIYETFQTETNIKE